MLAGKTAIKSKISPMPANVRVCGIKSKMAPNISKQPLKQTRSSWDGRYDGMIFRNGAGCKKCIVPENANNDAIKIKRVILIIRMSTASLLHKFRIGSDNLPSLLAK